jgi:DNA-binding response OmpR family regulator
MLTGELTVDRSLQALEHGAADFILKPIDVNELLIIVRICEAKILRWWGIVRTAFRKQKAKAKEEQTCGK